VEEKVKHEANTKLVASKAGESFQYTPLKKAKKLSPLTDLGGL
jgi:hypothetical protein